MTIGTILFTWAKGKLVGTDSQGNRYYNERWARNGYRQRRWVVYKGPVDASRVPPEWHAWLHYTVDQPLASAPEKPWLKEHRPNLTGTPGAYLPPGHDRRGGHRPAATGDYEAWQP
ncbi:NADH:ubiquinone oxidoreductase subunit NDUFA12 [Telmatospirillum siberiense]|uniref:NADH:ubiquinone oxidoreductase subunit NDUFA12 n=1 Tax=Telmatospirillum siberiense TaxID=382514 RepID=A0A2N3PM02_9PROT|nr:NADH:ubiquinone oxidoreductase subunit NDUFA12 [Telmatospirillum siberiense]PKU21416.1 NADH:ubiquinone oxidoreductase subunit NDUFA12 [Telmatospirillum siberiense]